MSEKLAGDLLLRLLILLLIAAPALEQESIVQVIPAGCTSVTVDATPTTPGSVTVTCPSLSITTPVQLPKAANNTPYSADLAFYAKPTGGFPPYTYTLNPTNPVPPWWLTISPTGKVGGTPNRKGSFSFSFTVRDSSAKLTQSQAGQGNLNVSPPASAYVPSGDKHAR